MIWDNVEIIKPATVTDDLGNTIPSGNYDIILSAHGRLHTDTKLTVTGGRRLEEGEAVIQVPCPAALIKGATHVRYNGKLYGIAGITPLPPRWSLLTVKGWHQ